MSEREDCAPRPAPSADHPPGHAATPPSYITHVEGHDRERRCMRLLVLTFVLLYGASFRTARPGWPLGETAYELNPVEKTLIGTTESLVLRHRTSVTAGHVRRGADRRFYPRYGVGAPLVHAPLFALGRILSGGRRSAAWHAARATSVLLGALIVLAVYRLGRQCGGGAGSAAATAMAAGVGTMLWPATQWVTPHLTSTLLVAAAATASITYHRYPRVQSLAVASVCLAGAVLARPITVILAPILLAAVFAYRPRRMGAQASRILIYLLPTAAAAAWTLWYNDARFGRCLDFGYGRHAFTWPLGESVPGLLWGARTGLIWHNPPTVLGAAVLVWLARHHRREGWVLGALSAALFLSAAAWDEWDGRGVRGPVLLTEAVPLLAAPTAALLARRRAGRPGWLALIVLAVAGAAVQAPAVLAPDAAGRPACWWGAWPWVGVTAAAAVVAAAAATLVLAVRFDRDAVRLPARPARR